VLPADVPHGYAELVATDEDGAMVGTWVLVGPRNQGVGTPGTGSDEGPSLDPAVLLLAAAFGLAGLLLLAGILRSARR
jgi:hypothetical protein